MTDTWRPSGAPDSGPLRDAFLEVQRRKREIEVDGRRHAADVIATVKRKLADEIPGLAEVKNEERLDRLAKITIGGMLWVAKMLTDYNLSFVEGWGVAESLSDTLKNELGTEDGITSPGIEAGVGAGLYTGIWMGFLLAEARSAPVSDADTVAVTFHKAVCSRCGDSPDLNGGEYQTTPEGAVALALNDEDSGFERDADGKLVCEDCRLEVDWGDVD